jgi:hypothetical protein
MSTEPPKEKDATGDKPNPLGGMGDQLDLVKFITYAILIVLFIGFAGMFVATGAMLWGAWKDKEGAFNILQDKINSSNKAINMLCQKDFIQ